MNIRALVVDDEPLARNRIKRLLATEPDVTMLGECATGRAAIQAIQEQSPNLVFLDVQMPKVNGFDVLQAIPPDKLPSVIFVTAFDEHALRAFEVHALDYLLKPFKEERFREALQRARRHLAGQNRNVADLGLSALLQNLRPKEGYLTRFMVKSANRVVFVKTEEVDWIESASNYALLHVGEKTHMVRETMRALEAKLDPKIFQRISRSVIVNLERVQQLQPMGKGEFIVILANGRQLTMSRGIRDLQQALEAG